MSDMNELRALVGVTNMLNARTKLEQAHPDDKAQFLRELGIQPQALKVVIVDGEGESKELGPYRQGVVLEAKDRFSAWEVKDVASGKVIGTLLKDPGIFHDNQLYRDAKVFIHPTVAD